MSETPSGERMEQLCRSEHFNCFACRSVENGGLGLCFELEDGRVKADWTCPSDKESYSGIVHGGILATVMDSAMVHMLFAHGVCAKTGRYEIRYKNSVLSMRNMTIRASIREYRHPLYIMDASIEQDGKTCVSATARFMSMH